MNGEFILSLVGRPLEDPDVQRLLATRARGIQPELDTEDTESTFDWIVLNELGLKLCFEDEAYLNADDAEKRQHGRLIFSGAWFHADTPEMQPFRERWPFGLAPGQLRESVCQALAEYEELRTYYLHDAWRLPALDITACYDAVGTLESLYCRLRPQPWRSVRTPVRSMLPADFEGLFGRRWSSASLRLAVAAFGGDELLAGARREHLIDLRRDFGVELHFSPGVRVRGSDPLFPGALVFSAVTYYAERELDASQWRGKMPWGLVFDDTQAQLARKWASRPTVRHDTPLSGYALWLGEMSGLQVLYSNLENRILRVTLMAPGFWPID